MKPGHRLLAMLLCCVLALAPSGNPVQASTPYPPLTMSQPAEIDAHLGYKPQRTCSPSAKPGTQALLKLLIHNWGGSSSGISRSCAVGGISEHKEGRALDWHMDVANKSQRNRVAQALNWLTANNGEVAYRLGIMYIIWNQQIWSIYYQEMGWRKMENRGSYTSNHKDHVHISLSWDGAMQQTSWWTGVPVTTPLFGPCGAGASVACLPTIPRSASYKWSFPHAKIGEFTPAPGDTPQIKGSPLVGQILSVVPSRRMAAAQSLRYQWYANKKPISYATRATLRITKALLRKEISVGMVAQMPNAETISQKAVGTTAVAPGKITYAPRPQIWGDPNVGSPLSVQVSWTPRSVLKFSYQWYRGSKAIPNATKAKYVPTTADLNKQLSVKVRGWGDQIAARAVTSLAVKIAPAKPAVPMPEPEIPPTTPAPEPTWPTPEPNTPAPEQT